MRRTKDFNIADIGKDTRIVIYGAGRYGELAYWGLKSLGIEPNYFMDRSRAGERLYGIAIISPSCISEYKEDAVLIASYNYYNEISKFLLDNGAQNVYNISSLLDLEYDESVLSEYLMDEKHNSDKYRNVVENEYDSELIINHCELVVTEKCTLRCKNCANLMQYYDSPQNAEISDIDAFGNFIESIDKLLDWRILGGEPFCYPRLDELINRYSTNPKIVRTTIYTNSTLLPSQNVLRAMRDNDVVVHMSNYGLVSSKLVQLDKVLSENGIRHYIHDYSVWKNLGELVRRNYSINELEAVYANCVMATCYTFHKGKFWICPRAAHGENMHYYSGKQDEFVDFNDSKDVLYKREQLENLLKRRKPIEACNYCSGSGKNSEEIRAAEQQH